MVLILELVNQLILRRIKMLSNQYKKEALEAARDLCYGREIINKIREAKSDNEISRIMKSARERRK